MHIHAMPQNDQMKLTIQSHNGQTSNQTANAPRLNLTDYLTCYKYRDKKHLSNECPHTGNTNVSQSQYTQVPLSPQTGQTGISLISNKPHLFTDNYCQNNNFFQTMAGFDKMTKSRQQIAEKNG